MIRVFIREFTGYLNSLIAYIVIAVFLVGIGLPAWVFPESSLLDYGYADLGTLFTTGPYLLMFLAPAVTMRSFAEERKLGTLELLFTKPLSDGQILFGKFFAAWALAVVAMLPTLTYYYSVWMLGSPQGNIDTPGFIGSFTGMILLAGLFTTMGMLASALTSSQVVSFLIAAVYCFLSYSGFESVSGLALWGDNGLMIKQLGVFHHYESMGRGLIDSRDLVYFLTFGGINLATAATVIASRKW